MACGADATLLVGEADMEAVALTGITARREGALTSGADVALIVGEGDMEAYALSGVTD